jgi:hypothetical protein
MGGWRGLRRWRGLSRVLVLIRILGQDRGGFMLFDESLKIRNKYWAITVCSHKKLAGFYRVALAVKNFSFTANFSAEYVAANFL